MIQTLKKLNISRKKYILFLAVFAWQWSFPGMVNTIELLDHQKEYEVEWTFPSVVTAYSSEVWQTDSTPCITANGFDLCKHNQENIIATNYLPFGTLVRIPEIFGDRIFIVQDRMNKRYTYNVDVWMRQTADAKNFGAHFVTIEVVKDSFESKLAAK